MRKRRLGVTLVLLAAGFASSSVDARASTCDYVGASGATWHNAINWSCDSTPSADADGIPDGDDAVRILGTDNVVVVLTADHGMTPFPERSRSLGRAAAVRVIPDSIIKNVNAALDSRAGGADWLVFDTGMLLVSERTKLAAQGVDVDSVIGDVAARLRAVPGVARVDRPADLAGRDTTDAVVRRWRHQIPPDAGVELVVTLKPYAIWSYENLPIAMHGQPTELDTHVPLILWGRGSGAACTAAG